MLLPHPGSSDHGSAGGTSAGGTSAGGTSAGGTSAGGTSAGDPSSSDPTPRRPALLPQDGPEEWPYLDRNLLVTSRSSRVCLTCHWFRHAAPAGGIPLLTCERHRRLLVHGEHLTRRCQGWIADQPGSWAPEAA